MALTREVCALKVIESQLLAGVAAANGNADAAQARIVHLEAELAERKTTPAALHARATASGGAGTAQLQATLTARDTELYSVRSELLEARQAAERLVAQVESAEAQSEERAEQVQREKESASRAVAQTREELAAQHCQEREALTASIARAQDEIAALKAAVQETVRRLRVFARLLRRNSVCLRFGACALTCRRISAARRWAMHRTVRSTGSAPPYKRPCKAQCPITSTRRRLRRNKRRKRAAPS